MSEAAEYKAKCDEVLLPRARNHSIGLSFDGCSSREQVMERLMAAQAKVLAAAPVLMSDKYKFDGDEIHGKRRPGHEAN